MTESVSNNQSTNGGAVQRLLAAAAQDYKQHNSPKTRERVDVQREETRARVQEAAMAWGSQG